MKWWTRRQERRMQAAEYAVVGTLWFRPDLSLAEIWELSGLSSGRTAVALIRLERDGVITARKATDGRRYYRLAAR